MCYHTMQCNFILVYHLDFVGGDVFETLVPDRITPPVVGSRDRSTDMKLFDTTAFIDMKLRTISLSHRSRFEHFVFSSL